MATNKFGYFSRAIVAYLRASSTLVTETGHAAGDERIVTASGYDNLPDKGCFLFIRPARKLFDEVDRGPYNTSVHLYLKATTSVDIYQMLGIIQEYVAQIAGSATDASYALDANVNLFSIRWSDDHSNAPEVQKDANGFWWSDAFLLVRWREVAA